MHRNTGKQEQDELVAAEPVARKQQQRLLYRDVLDFGDGVVKFYSGTTTFRLQVPLPFALWRDSLEFTDLHCSA